jgi:alpha-glucoside transport system substrate-binding protein
MRSKHRAAFAALVAAGVLITACGSSKKSESTSAPTTAAGATTTAGAATTTAAGAATTAAGGATTVAGGAATSLVDGKIQCTQQYKGKKVTLFSSIRDVEADNLVKAYDAFEKCTGADVQHEGSGEFEAQLKVRIDGGNAPDIAVIPQPGLMADLARQGKLVPEPDVGAYVKENDLAGYDQIGSVDGQFYGAPLSANVKSLVWYNPQNFKAKGYAIPQTLDEMKALSDKIVADGGKPWCAGIESGGATGWPATDWIEDFVLRLEGPDVYDQWVTHKIPFNDPKIKEATDAVGGYLKNEKYINGGVKSIAVTSFQEGGLGILDGSCYMHRQASFYANQFPKGTVIGEDGTANWFYLPVAKAGDKKAMLTGGEFMAITKGNDRPEVKDTQLFMTSADYANARASFGSWISPNKGLKSESIPVKSDQDFAQLLLSSDVARFDGSDTMPGAVGSGTEWKQITAWITGESTDDFLKNVEDSWPKS